MNKQNVLFERLPILGSKRILVTSLAAVAIAGGAMFLATRSSATPAPTKPAVAMTVTVAPAAEAEWPALLEASGAIAPWQEAVIGAQVAGLRLAEIRANVGDRVRRGQVLASFDADLLRADEARVKATSQQAEANRQRALMLRGTGSISESEVLQYVTQADVAKAQLQTTQLQLRYAEVVAPDDGVISARNATLGAVSASGQELFRMIRQSRLEWRGELSAQQLAQIKPGQHVRVSLPDGSTATARVRQVAPGLDAQTRLGIVYADIDSGSGARAGMYAKGSIVLAQSRALVVPAASLVIRDGRIYVLKLVGADRVAQEAVTVGRRQNDAVEIIAGIAVGERVVVQGAGFLNDRDVVRVVPAAKE